MRKLFFLIILGDWVVTKTTAQSLMEQVLMKNFINTSYLSDSKKMRILMTMSVFRNSINFWDQRK
jgi:hypothetical protein